MRALAILAALASLGAMPASSPAAGYMVVVNADNAVKEIDRELLSKLFMRRVMKWPDGRPVEPVDLSRNEVARAAFTRDIHRKSVGAVRAFWQQQIFSGRDVPPLEKDGDRDVLEFVRAHAGAVGYVSSECELGAGVKTITVVGVKR